MLHQPLQHICNLLKLAPNRGMGHQILTDNESLLTFQPPKLCVKFCQEWQLYLQIVNDVHVLQLQLAVDALVAWAKEWQLSTSVNKCCMLNVGKVTYDTYLSIDGIALPVDCR